MRRDRMMAVLGFALVTLWSLLVAQNPPQTPDTSRISLRVTEIRHRIKVEEPTVIAFAKSRADISHVGIEAHPEIAERLGFAFTIAIGEHPSVVDVRYNAVQYVPEDASAGFIMIVPGRRAELIRGFVDAAQFEERLRTYRPAVRWF